MVLQSGEELLKREDVMESSIMSVSEIGYMTSPHGHMGDALGKRKATAHVEGMTSTWTPTYTIHMFSLSQTSRGPACKVG